MRIGELNEKDCGGFVEALGWVFESSPWVAERAWKMRPFASLDDLHGAMVAAVASAPVEAQRALLCAHPDLGARAAMSDASNREQAGAGLKALTQDEYDRLRALNSAYREKFGFPFLFAVKGAGKHDVLGALERRLTASPEAEQEEALRQVYRIARFRLDQLLGDPDKERS